MEHELLAIASLNHLLWRHEHEEPLPASVVRHIRSAVQCLQARQQQEQRVVAQR